MSERPDRADRDQRRAVMKQIGETVNGLFPAAPDGTGTIAWMEARILQASTVAAEAGVTVDGVTVMRVTGGPETVTVVTPDGTSEVPVFYSDPLQEMAEDGHVFFIEFNVSGASTFPMFGFNGDGHSVEVLKAAHDLWLSTRQDNAVQVAAALYSE